MNLGDIKKALLEGGVVGAGGAGFPTYAKLSDQAVIPTMSDMVGTNNSTV